MADGLLSKVLGAIDRQKQTTKAGLGLLFSDPKEFAVQATAKYFPTRDEELQFRAVEQAGGDVTQTPYYQKMFDLSQFQGSIKPTPNQAAMAEIRKIQSDRNPTDLSWVNNPVTPNPPNPNKFLEYMIEHRPMQESGGASRLHEANKAFGEDIYTRNALQYFGSGLSGERTSLNIMNKVRGNPDAEITIYRGVPKGVKTINEGDWVTLDPKMAAEYGEVISKKVKVKDITTWPDSLVEFGYYPQK